MSKDDHSRGGVYYDNGQEWKADDPRGPRYAGKNDVVIDINPDVSDVAVVREAPKDSYEVCSFHLEGNIEKFAADVAGDTDYALSMRQFANAQLNKNVLNIIHGASAVLTGLTIAAAASDDSKSAILPGFYAGIYCMNSLLIIGTRFRLGEERWRNNRVNRDVILPATEKLDQHYAVKEVHKQGNKLSEEVAVVREELAVAISGKNPAGTYNGAADVTEIVLDYLYSSPPAYDKGATVRKGLAKQLQDMVEARTRGMDPLIMMALGIQVPAPEEVGKEVQRPVNLVMEYLGNTTIVDNPKAALAFLKENSISQEPRGV